MCGIIAYSGPRSPEAILVLECLLAESAKRGMHATGLAWLEDGEIRYVREALGARMLLEHHGLKDVAAGEAMLHFVGHTRYSTSDLAWNLPLEDRDCALVLNGVLSQEPPSCWPGSKAEPYKTGNDAEIALRASKKKAYGYIPGSFAIAELWRAGRVLVYRNHLRPLYLASMGTGYFAASTQDIFNRAFLSGPVGYNLMMRAIPGYVYDLATAKVTHMFPCPPDEIPVGEHLKDVLYGINS